MRAWLQKRAEDAASDGRTTVAPRAAKPSIATAIVLSIEEGAEGRGALRCTEAEVATKEASRSTRRTKLA